ncbi:Carbohydrate binding module (family 6) [Stigmatella erecta]|uniref:Carbohydrate binding module (Family 6) n=2 Tax=Stigmatella erecta TaxID=83460 RepID=A0A1I0GSF6_9BACT|nr:Carbohydrate binding module (family 6) [Stigmatella erecta]
MKSLWRTWGTRMLLMTSLSAGAGCLSPEALSPEESWALEQQAAATVYEAENAELLGGAVRATDHTGASGNAFVGGFTDGNKGNAAVRFTVTAASAGNHDVTLRYANGTGSPMTLSLYRGTTKLKQVTLAATANWDTWGTQTETLALSAGAQTLSYKFDTSDSGNVNLDSLSVNAVVTPPPQGSGPLYEAENAELLGGTVRATDHTGASGSAFVGGFTDSNKGNAAVRFTVTAAAAGTYEVALRYANGTGSVMTLSLYQGTTKLKQIPLEATANWDTWGTQTETLTLNAGAQTLSYKFDTSDSGNVNLDSLNVSAVAPPPPPPPAPPAGSGFVYEAEEQFFSGGVIRESTHLRNFAAVGARAIFTVNADTAKNHTVGLHYANPSGTTKTLNVYVNGLYFATTNLASTSTSGWALKTESLTLRRGLNTITYQYDPGTTGGVNINAVAIVDGKALSARGATLPYQELEAEAGSTNAAVLSPNRTPGTVEAESSGRRAVKLTQTGHYVQWTAPQAANSLVVRYSMPDTSTGTGTNATLSLYVNGSKVQALPLSSKHAWVYGGYPYGNSPSTPSKPNEWDPGPHRFYDESRFLLPSIPAGATVKLQKDSGDTAAYYTVDLIDLEQVDPALTMPMNFVSITDFGARADDGTDDTQAIRNAISNAKSTGKVGVWIPAGVFHMNGRVDLDNIHLRGAGPWYTRLQATNYGEHFYGTGNNVKVFDLSYFGDIVERRDDPDRAAFQESFGTGSHFQNIWIEHAKVAYWIRPPTDGLFIVNGRVRNVYADGINLHAGIKNSTVSHVHTRNTGDDAFAMWSDGNINENCTFRYNTAQLPNLANTFAIYNGRDNKLLDSVGSDTHYASSGVLVTDWFADLPFLGTTEIKRVTFNRTGGDQSVNFGMTAGAVWIHASRKAITGHILVDGVELNDSTFSGVKFSFGKTPPPTTPAVNNEPISNVTLNNITIKGSGTYGLETQNVPGTATCTNVTVTGSASGGLLNPSNRFTFNKVSGNSGW